MRNGGDDAQNFLSQIPLGHSSFSRCDIWRELLEKFGRTRLCTNRRDPGRPSSYRSERKAKGALPAQTHGRESADQRVSFARSRYARV